MEWKRLPIEGSIVEEIKVFGNGKDCEVTVTIQEPARVVQFTMRDPNLEIALQGRIKTVIFNEGHDSYLGTRYIPLEKAQLEVCAVEFPGDAQEWDMALSDFEKGHSDFIGWMIYNAKLQIKSIDSAISQE